jgi:hypothetical protein
MSLQAYDAPLNQRAAKEHAHGKYLRLGEELFAYLKAISQQSRPSGEAAVAIDADTKLFPSFMVGRRDLRTAYS